MHWYKRFCQKKANHDYDYDYDYERYFDTNFAGSLPSLADGARYAMLAWVSSIIPSTVAVFWILILFLLVKGRGIMRDLKWAHSHRILMRILLCMVIFYCMLTWCPPPCCRRTWSYAARILRGFRGEALRLHYSYMVAGEDEGGVKSGKFLSFDGSPGS